MGIPHLFSIHNGECKPETDEEGNSGPLQYNEQDYWKYTSEAVEEKKMISPSPAGLFGRTCDGGGGGDSGGGGGQKLATTPD